MSKRINRPFLAILVSSVIFMGMAIGEGNSYIELTVDAKHPTKEVFPNISSNINVWQLGNSFVNPKVEFPEYNEFKFVKWVQLMNCSGGSESRDLFKNPNDRTTLTDYNFDLLLRNCEGILQLGAKPYLKLGAVPLKLTTEPKINNSGFNIYPPDSYQQYYLYIKAIAESLVKHFGKKEVQSWRFGCLVEYENGSHFKARSEDAEDTYVEYCKLYDYTVQALVDVIGDEVFVGAHSMSVLDGLWDECRFIEHVAKGKNYANGGIGTKINLLSVSFYDNAPGNLSYRSLEETIKPLQDKAKECGLNDLIYGVDEGRVLSGTKGSMGASLNSRSTGLTWQAAEDARLFSQAIEMGMEYFSAWSYLTGGNITGYPTVSYHVASNISKFEGYRKIDVGYPLKKEKNKDVGCVAGVKNDTVRIAIYNFSTDINSREIEEIALNVQLPFKRRRAKVVKWLINDDCNFFDEWQDDREKYNITNDAFQWSPDDGQVEAKIILKDSVAMKKYNDCLRAKYIDCSRLKPSSISIRVKSGIYSEKMKLANNNVVFLQITKR